MNEESLFFAALERSSPSERRAFLDEACAGDDALRQRLAMLLAADENSRGLLDGGRSAATLLRVCAIAEPLASGRRFADRFALRCKLGEGGMGEVWAADQLEPIRRLVALKLVRPGLAFHHELARFGQERQALALMSHPNIARILDAGAADGRPYFVMELIDGLPITKYCADARLTLRQRLELFLPVCDAVQHAHQKGVIHRDIKPSNVLVTIVDGRPLAKVIDFGVAKAIEPRLAGDTVATEVGRLIGTPEYMSPEQADLNNPDIDTRSDVYALGVLLYELLTGCVPFSRQELLAAPLDEMLRRIKESEPPKPSTRLATAETLPQLAADRQTEPRKLIVQVQGELDWVIMKCLEKDRNRRYETPHALAADLGRYLCDEPVLACPPSASYRVRKFARRHWRGLSVLGAIGLVLIAGAVALSIGLFVINRERLEKEIALRAESKRRQQARAALDAMSSDITKDWLASQPGQLPQHKRFLERTLTLYEQFAADTGLDEESRADVARAYWRVGGIRAELGQLTDAAAALERSRSHFVALMRDFPDNPSHRAMHAVVLTSIGQLLVHAGRQQEAVLALEQSRTTFQSLVAEFPAAADYQGNLAITLGALGSSLKNLGRLPESVEVFTQSLGIFRALALELPADSKVRFGLATTLWDLGNLHGDAKQPEKAKAALREAVDQFSALVAENPTSPLYLDALANSQNSLANVLRDVDEYVEATSLFQQSVATRRKLAAEFPGVPEYQQVLASAVNNLGILLKDTGRLDEAEEQYAEAAAIHKKLADDFPEVPDHQNEAAGVHGNLARLKLMTEDFASARRLLDEALPYHRAALQANPSHPVYRKFYRITRWRLAEAHLGLKDHAAAATSVAEFQLYATEPPRDAYTAASLLAGCVRLASEDPQLTDTRRAEMVATYGNNALTALRQAVELKAKEVAQMRTDPALDPLRGRDDFQKLLAGP